MARIRTLKPDAFTSESLCSLPRGARWTFAGLLTYVDDEGRGRADPRLIRAAIYALDDDITADDVATELDMLEKIDTIRRYEVGGKRYLYFPHWDHQKISHPTASKLPAPPEHAPPHPPEELRNPLEPSGNILEASGPHARAPEVEQGTGKGKGKGNREAERASACEPESADEPVPIGVAGQAARLVAEHPHPLGRWTDQELHELRRGAATLLASAMPALHVAEGLRRLAARPDAGTGLLRHLAFDAMNGRPAPRPAHDPNAEIYRHDPAQTEHRAEVVPMDEWRRGA